MPTSSLGYYGRKGLSPLLIDCPPHKGGGISSAHADVDAAIAKFRMTAYMWQAMTAEDMRMKGLGRRSFRLDEEWTVDTVSREFSNASHTDSLHAEGAMRYVHLSVANNWSIMELELMDYYQDYGKGHGYSLFKRHQGDPGCSGCATERKCPSPGSLV